MIEELLTSEGLVREMLKAYPETRGNDALLYLVICKLINPKVGKMPYEKVLINSAQMGLPNYETITRCRRKLQAEDEELRATREKTNNRYVRWKVFREYATE